MADTVAGPIFDILPNREGPPLSATSDMPVVTQPEPEVADAPIPEPKPEAKPESQPEAQTDEAVAAGAADAKPEKVDATPPALKAEITKERNRRREAETARIEADKKADQLSTDLSKALEAITKLTTAPAQDPAAADPKPLRTAFDDPDTYDTALIDWSARQATRIATAEAEAKHLADTEAAKADQAAKEQADAHAKLAEDWQAKKTKAMEKYPDYAEVAESDALQISLPMSQAILNAEDGPALAYYLGKHPEESAEIAKLNPVQAVFRMGQIAAKLAVPPPVSKAPDPIVPIGSRERAGAKSPSEMTMEEYAADAAVQTRLKRDRSPNFAH